MPSMTFSASARGAVVANNTVALLGDSRVFRVDGNAQNAGFMHHSGFALWARRLTHGQVQFNLANQFGVGGYTTQEVVDNTLDDAAASDAGSVLVMVGVNDWGEGISTATSTANIDTICSTLTAAGKAVFICDDSPASGETGAALTQHVAIRDHIRGLSMPRVYVVPSWNAVAATPDGTSPGSGMEDTVHYGPGAASRVGVACANVMGPRLPTFDLAARSGVLSGGDFTGTGGTKTGVTGTVPDGWTVALESGTGTVACSIAAADGLNWLVVALSNGDTPVIGIYSGDLDSGWTAGTDRLDMAVKCRIDAGSANVISCQLHARRESGTQLKLATTRNAGDGIIVNNTTAPLPATELDMTLWLPHVLFPTGATQLIQRMEIRGLTGTTSSGTFRFALPQLRKYTGSLTD